MKPEKTTASLPKTNKLRRELVEEDEEWIVEARGEGYTWKQLASKYGVSVPTLKKYLYGK